MTLSRGKPILTMQIQKATIKLAAGIAKTMGVDGHSVSQSDAFYA